ncbi:MAG: hypothetical protein Q4D38_08055 [Planctomycetia bacterium]|nr:hypothetical protein [Planctomycetia bacterium]
MPCAKLYYGTVLTSGSVALLARIVGEYSEVLKRSEFSSGHYSVFRLEETNEFRKTPIEGHYEKPLDLDSVLFNVLQKDASWNIDTSGYNFRHVLGCRENDIFALSERLYQVEYTLQPSDERRLPVRVFFRLRTL